MRLFGRFVLASLLPLCWLAWPALAWSQEAPLLTVAQVRALPVEELAAGKVVRVRGVVTYAAREEFLMFVQDETGGIYVFPPNEPLEAGTRVEVEGRTHPGKFATRIDSLDPSARMPGVKITVLGTAELPLARPMEGRDLRGSALLFRRVEMTGVVRAIEREERRVTLDLTTSAGEVGTVLPRAVAGDDFPPESWVGAVVRVRGVAAAEWNERREQTGLNVLVPRREDLELVQGGIASFLDLPARSIASLGQFSDEAGPRVRVRGVVTLHEPGRGLFLRDGGDALWVKTPQPAPLAPGAVVDAVGFPARDGEQPLLDDGFCVARETGPPPEPLAISADAAMEGKHHGQLVRVRGFVVDRFFSPGNNTLALQSGDNMFDARLVRDPRDREVKLAPRGSWVAVTGVCVNRAGGATSPEVGGGKYQPVAFQLLMRSMEDIAVLREPSWWTTERVAWVLAGVSAALLLALGAVGMLVRRNRRQTTLLRETRERAAVQEERQRIARELHDTLEQELTGISLTLDAASDTLEDSPATAGTALERARQLLRHTRSEARRSIWDLRAVALEQGDLPRALREMAAHFPQPPAVEITVEGTSRRLSALTENNLLRIATEALTNAVKHAHAQRIDVTLAFAPETVTLTVRDDGAGFDFVRASALSEGHFGLLGMRERAQQSGADLVIDSAPGRGTTIEVRSREADTPVGCEADTPVRSNPPADRSVRITS